MTYSDNSIFKKPLHAVTEHTTNQVTSSSANSFITINGSEMSYIPASDAVKVVYEISFYAKKAGWITFSAVQLEEYVNSSWSEINAKYRRNFGNSGPAAQTNRYLLHYRFVLPAWSGEKQLRLRISPPWAGRSVVLHEIDYWEGSSISSMYMNTSLLLYSI
jgi:hypothetical protein